MIRLEQVVIENYKNICADELKLENLNVVVGPNNSGKSNFMQIFSFLNHIINGSGDEIKTEFGEGYFNDFGRIISNNQLTEKKGSIKIAIRFLNTLDETQYNYQIKLGWNKSDPYVYVHHIDEESFDYKDIHKTGPPINIFSRVGKKIKLGSNIPKILDEIPRNVSVANVLKMVISKNSKHTHYVNGLKALDKILKTETIYFSNIELTKSASKRLSKYGGRTVAFDFLNAIRNLEKDKIKYSFLKETLFNILKIDDIIILALGNKRLDKDTNLEDEFVVAFNHLGNLKMIDELSDGSVLLIALITMIISSKQDIIFIEEPENSLHPKALVDLMSFLSGFLDEKQFFIATHSIPIINRVKPEDTIIAKCDQKGNSTLTRVENLRDLKKRLKQGYIVFSDALFFENDETD